MKNVITIILTLLIYNSFGQVKNSIENNVNNAARIATTDTTVFIPVVIHVIASGQANETFPTDAQIIAKINELNSVFNGTASFLGNPLNIGIQFRLAKLSPECTSTTGIERLDYSTNQQYKNNGVQFDTKKGISEIELKKNTQWETSQYLNIWIVNKIDGYDSGAYTWMPDEAAGKDGIVITSSDFMLPNFNLLANQMGHFFNLYDLWAKLSPRPNTSVFCGDDDVTDTDYVEEYSGDARTGINPCTTFPYNASTEYNFMSHNNLRNRFTQGQKVRMRGALQLPNRKSLVNSITDELSSCLFNSTNTPVFTHNATPVNSFKTLGIGKGGYIYAGTDKQGLYKFTGHEWKKINAKTNTNLDVINNNNFSDIKTDKNGGIWAAQYGSTNGTTTAYLGGLNYLPDSSDIGFIYYSSLSNGLPTRYCRGVYIDTSFSQTNPRIWTANFAHISGGTSSSGAVGLGVNSTSPNFTSITAGIDISTQTVSVQTIGGDENEIWAFASGNRGKSEILVYNSQTAAFKKAYNNNSVGFPALGNFLAKSIYFDKYKYYDTTAQAEKTLDRRWVGVSNGGVLVYEKPLLGTAEGTWLHINNTTHPTIFPSGSVVNTNSITSDKSGFIYFGTTQGLVVFFGGDIANELNYQRLTTVEGLPSNNVLDIIDAPHLGRIIISTAEGIVFWSKEKFKKKNAKNTILNLAENFNQPHYTVPREATVHHYFIIKDKLSTPLIGAYIVYKLSNLPNHFFISDPSDENGLIDLNLAVGGGDVNISTDDYIPTGSNNVTVSFDEVYDENLDIVDIGTNHFKNYPFTISVIDKAEPIEEEFGIGLDLSIGGELIDGTSVNIGNSKVEMGYGSIGIGGTYSPSLTFVPDNNNPSIWKTKIASPLGVKINTSAGPKFEEKVGRFGVEAGVSVDLEGSFGTVEEYNYNLDITNNSHLFFLGANIFSTGVKLNPSTFMLSNFLYRLASFSGLANSEKYGFNVGLEGGVDANTTFGISKEFKRNSTSGEIGLGFGAGLKAGFNANIEFSAEFTQSEGVNISTTATAETSANAGVNIGISAEEKEKEADEEEKNENTLPFSSAEASVQKKFSITLNRHLDNFNGNLLDASVTFSNEEEKEIGADTYNITYNNKLGYSKTAIDEIGQIPNNYVAAFFKDGVTLTTPFSLVSSAVSGVVGSFRQIKDYQSSIFNKQQRHFVANNFSVTNTRDITRINDYSIGFGLAAFVGVEFELKVKEWNKYTHNLKNYEYAKDFNKLLPVIDYPAIESNIQLPPQTPLAAVIDGIWDKIDNTAIEVLNVAKSFVNEVSNIMSNVAISFSNNQNGNVQRLMLDATPFKSPANKSPQTSAPSVFTFTVPGGNQAFNTGTNILFKYYYPENQLKAITLSDTFKIITDVFFLNAMNGTTDLNTAPNGNFTINSQFSSYELELAGLPTNLAPQVLFLPNGSTTWEVIGAANQTINFNRLGTFAIGVSLQKDFIPPTITVVPPASFVDGQQFAVSLTDNLSGIDWSKTYFVANGKIIPYQRVGTSNTFNLDIALLHAIPVQLPEIFDIQIRTIDLAGNKKNFFHTYPCEKAIHFLNILGGASSTSNKHQASVTIEISGSAATKPPLEIKAGKNIILNPGFEVKPINGEYFKANIGGCN